MTNKPKSDFAPSVDTFLKALHVYGYEMSDRAIEPYLKKEIIEFLAKEHTPREVYDFCMRLHNAPFCRMDEHFTTGDIDAFGHALFDVSKLWERPAE